MSSRSLRPSTVACGAGCITVGKSGVICRLYVFAAPMPQPSQLKKGAVRFVIDCGTPAARSAGRMILRRTPPACE